MVIGSAYLKLQAPWVHSLKEKRMVVQSIIQKTKHKFNVSVAEVDEMDTHQTIILGICVVSNNKNHANSVLDHVVNFMEDNTEAVLEQVEYEFF